MISTTIDRIRMYFVQIISRKKPVELEKNVCVCLCICIKRILFKVKLALITMQIGSQNVILSTKKETEKLAFICGECIIYQAVYGLKNILAF